MGLKESGKSRSIHVASFEDILHDMHSERKRIFSETSLEMGTRHLNNTHGGISLVFVTFCFTVFLLLQYMQEISWRRKSRHFMGATSWDLKKSADAFLYQRVWQVWVDHDETVSLRSIRDLQRDASQFIHLWTSSHRRLRLAIFCQWTLWIR